MNIFDYLTTVKEQTFYDQSLTILDLLLLTELAYIDFDGEVTADFDHYHSQRLDQVATRLDHLTPNPSMSKDHLRLLKEMSQSLRFQSCKVMGYVNDIDLEVEKQFSATTFKLKPDTYVVAFRGTDDSIIGWKEDFHMTYMSQIPAQKMARDYLRQMLQQLPGQVYVTGHSKGGNLAIFAASQLETDLQERISLITSFDGPGLHTSIIRSAGYAAIRHKIERYIPQGSIVGMMLEIPETAQIVISRRIHGISQHNPFYWQIQGNDFLLADRVNSDSLQTDKTLKTWLESVSDEEKKIFFDLFFGLMLDANIHSISGFFEGDSLQLLSNLLTNAKNLDSQDSDLLKRLIGLLIDLRFQYFKEELPALPSLPNLFSKAKKEELENSTSPEEAL